MNYSIQESEINAMTERLQQFDNIIGQYEKGLLPEDDFLRELNLIETIDLKSENMFNQMLGYSVLAGAYRALKKKKLSYSEAYYDNEYVYKEISYLHNVQYVVTRVSKEGLEALYYTAARTACYTYYTLSNAYDHMGRFNEAQQYLRMAMYDPHLSQDIEIAQGFSYANMHTFYKEEEPWVVRRGKIIMDKYPNVFDEASPELRLRLRDCRVPSFEPPLAEYPDSEEGKFRYWVNENYLRLNRYVDIEPHSQLSQADNVKLPFIWESEGKRKLYQSTFEEINGMYIASLQILYSTFGSKSNVLSKEQLKMAYKNFYSILDKISLILANYLGLQMKAHEIDFKSIWYDKKKKCIRPEVKAKKQNISLLALYNIQNDIYGCPIEGFIPDEQTINLHRIRNFMEHKSFIIEDGPMKYDEYQLHISQHELSMDAIRLAQLSRCAIIYLCNFVLHEEYDRHGDIPLRRFKSDKKNGQN